MTEELRCTLHQETTTRLRCGGCGDPICPQCVVHGQVGIRCLDCGKMSNHSNLKLSGQYLVRAVLTAALSGIASGFIYAYILVLLPFVLDTVFLLGVGYAVAEATKMASDRRTGRTLQYTVGGGLLICFAIILFVSPTLDIWTLIGMVIAFLVGTGRVR